ncbi:MAG: PAS domain-containing sensor histidine kinase, partial [Salinirussus sp.]
GQDRILAVVRDVSDRKQQEERLEAAVERMEFTLDATDSVVYDVDLETRREVNHGPYERLYGVDIGALETSDHVLEEIVHPDDLDRVKELQRLETLEANDWQIEYDYRAHPERGEAAWIRSEAYVAFDEDGMPDRLVGLATDISDRKAQERKRETIIDRVTDGIVEVDSEWSITLINEQARSLTEKTESPLLGTDLRSVFAESDEQVTNRCAEVMETREPDSLVGYSASLDGWFDVQIYPEPGGGLAIYFQDITDRVERRQEIEQMRELLEHTEEIADVGGWEIDTETEDVFWTDHLFEMLGIEGDEEPPLAEALDVYIEEDRPKVERAVEAALTNGEVFDVDARYERTDGKLRWFQIRGEPTIENGEVVTLRGAVQDITARKERQQRLERTEARFQALAENFPNGGVHYFDEDFRYEYVAGAGFEAIETTPADLEGQTIYEVTPYSEAIVSTLESLMEQTLAGSEVSLEVDYEGRMYELRSAPIRDSEGEIIGGFFITQDITERRQRETTLEAQNERLERFTKAVSHDLRSPLAVAQGGVELAIEECDSEHLETAASALDRSEQLIEDLLDVAREGSQVDELNPVELETVARDSWAHVETADATLDVAADQTILADGSRLGQMLENLYRNAVEHGGPDVAVTVGEVQDGFYVEDDGPGIPENRRESVFEFGQSTEDGRSGFGLAIVEQIAVGHGWTVQATTGSEGGARIEVRGVKTASSEA